MTAAAEGWMTLDETATYCRVSYETVRRAAIEYQRTGGERGLESYQRVARGYHKVPVSGADRWVRGEPPRRQPRKAVAR